MKKRANKILAGVIIFFYICIIVITFTALSAGQIVLG